MKKTLATLALALTLCATAFADEGMWMLPLLQKINSKAMDKLGCHLSADDIYSINHSSLKDAIVQFGGGCTGEIISAEGLLSTNHHCGYSSIQALSTPEHNYLEDGYWAMDRSQELPVPGLSVKFLERMEDVSGQMEGLDDDSVKAKVRKICNAAREQNPGCEVTVLPFYNDNAYYLIVYKVYRDIRFVGAPPASLGKFGGDTDNWMWPRHTCDFSMFRVYAGQDNEPADYSPDNKPYRPKQFLKISLKGVKDGDFAMIMGYPGRTNRFQTASQLEQMLDVQDIKIAARTVRQDVMWEARMADPVVNLQYASKYAGSSNGWKKWIGMKEAFGNLDIINREKEKEQAFQEWIAAKHKRAVAYGGALEKIDSAVCAGSKTAKALTLLSESVARIELVGIAQAMEAAAATAQAVAKQDSAKAAAVMERTLKAVKDALQDYNEPLDRKEAAALLDFYCKNVAPEDVISFDGTPLTELDLDELVNLLYENTNFTSEAGLARLQSAEDIFNEPATLLAKSLMDKMLELSEEMGEVTPAIAEGSKAYTAGLLEWNKGEASYPDANFTMRLTYGSVKSYSPKDGVLYKHYTTLEGVMEKEDPDNYEFRVPEGLKKIYEEKDYGPYCTKDGQMPTCFLTNCDITGGNSGSPVLNADGELIGLAFDGNWEAMSSDVMFEPNLQRCICVDIRYVLLAMDKLGGAGWLLKEMKLVK